MTEALLDTLADLTQKGIRATVFCSMSILDADGETSSKSPHCQLWLEGTTKHVRLEYYMTWVESQTAGLSFITGSKTITLEDKHLNDNKIIMHNSLLWPGSKFDSSARLGAAVVFSKEDNLRYLLVNCAAPYVDSSELLALKRSAKLQEMQFKASEQQLAEKIQSEDARLKVLLSSHVDKI